MALTRFNRENRLVKLFFLGVLILSVLPGRTGLSWSVLFVPPLVHPVQVSGAESCPKDLSHLLPEIEKYLSFISAPEFTSTIRSTVQKSIPQAIQDADGIQAQILFLQQEIARQDRVLRDAESIARQASDNPSGTLTPCPPGEKGSYCSSVELYFIASVAKFTHQGFLDALLCYQKQGVR